MIRTEFPKLPKKNADRVKGQIYINNKNEIVKWCGKYLRNMCRCRKARPSYNIEGESTAICCSLCKTPEMVDVVNNRCEHEGCQKQPAFNVQGQKKGRFCGEHKLDGMVDVTHTSCKQGCNTRCNNDKYDGYCLRCFMYLFPDKPVSRNYKTKEFAVVEYVTTEFPDVDWVADKIVNGGCSKRRPDLLLDLGYQVIIIEVDENQHTDYDCSCENKRIMELSQDAGHRPIVFIRFNPDNYVNSDGSKITSCWGTNGKEWIQRLNCLKESINYWINPENKTNKTVETIQLFYDDWN